MACSPSTERRHVTSTRSACRKHGRRSGAQPRGTLLRPLPALREPRALADGNDLGGRATRTVTTEE